MMIKLITALERSFSLTCLWNIVFDRIPESTAYLPLFLQHEKNFALPTQSKNKRQPERFDAADF